MHASIVVAGICVSLASDPPASLADIVRLAEASELAPEEAVANAQSSTPADAAKPSASKMTPLGPTEALRTAKQTGGSGSSPAAPIVGAIAIGIAACALAYLKRRRPQGSRMRIVDRLGIGPRQHIIVVSVGAKNVLMSVNPSGVSLILDHVELPLDEAAPSPGGLAPRGAALYRMFARERNRDEAKFESDIAACREDTELRRKLSGAQRRA